MGVGGATKTYVDDVFSNYLWAGDGDNNRVITTNIDQSGEGCLTWIKSRTAGEDHVLVDTVRGVSKIISSNSGGTEVGNVDVVPAFTSAGFKPGSHSSVNGSGNDFAGWTFRKAPGFFDIVTWSGNASAGRQIPHNLGCVPGAIFTKRLNVSENWLCYYNVVGNDKYLHLNTTGSPSTASYWNDTDPTSTYFTVNDAQQINGAGYNYVAYVFAGGPAASTSQVKLLCCKNSSSATASDTGNTITATNVTATSDSPGTTSGACSFSGTDNWLDVAASSDFEFGTGDFTVEMYVNVDATNADGLYRRIYVNDGPTLNDDNNFQIAINPSTGGINLWSNSGGLPALDITGTTNIGGGGWHHVAAVRISGQLTLYVDGLKEASTYWPTSVTANSGEPRPRIGSAGTNNWGDFEGKISNVRVTKGLGIYSTNFTWGNNNAGVDYTTTTYPQDPESFKFGASGNQNIIKHELIRLDASGRATVNLGFEPQWLMWKKTNDTGGWGMYDAMRGVYSGSSDNYMIANGGNTEAATGVDILNWTPTGFECHLSAHNNGEFLVTCIRRPDGYVGKPASAGTDVFALDTGNSSATIPAMDSGFPVDWAFRRAPASTSEWYAQYRMMNPDDGLQLDSDAIVQSGFGSTQKFDSNLGWAYSLQSTYQSWMWKRGKGFDLVFYDGNSESKRAIPHSLNAVPEMFWIKRRSGGSGDKWAVYHSALGNTKYLRVNTTQYAYTDAIWNNTTPTSTHFTLGTDSAVNNSSGTYVAMLFSSVTGVSKVGTYTGTANSAQSISLGFQPRFITIKNATDSSNNWTTGWFTYDTLNGWSSPNTNYMFLDNDMATQTTGGDCAPTSTGFDISGGSNNYINNNGDTYVYYAHA